MRLNVDMLDELYAAFAAKAAKRGRSMSDVVREVIYRWTWCETEAVAELPAELPSAGGKELKDERGCAG